MPDLWEKLSEVYNMDSVPDEAKSIIGDVMLAWSEGQEGDTISRKAAIDAICEDGTWLERQGCTEITMAERKQRDVDILSDLPSFSRDHEYDHSAEFSKKVEQSEACEDDPRADVYYLAEKIGIHRLYALVAALRGEPEMHHCCNCGRTANNGGWYKDGRTRCPIEEHYQLPIDGYCHLWEKRNVTDDDYPERREE